MRPLKMVRDPSYLLLFGAAIFAGFAIAWHPPGPTEAAHFLGEHALNFHACGPQVTYSNTTLSPGVVSQATMDSVFNTAFENGWGWDSNCGNKIARGTAYNQAYVWTTANVDAYCGGPAWGCIYRSAGPYNGHEYQYYVFFRDTAFRDHPLYVTNHEFGHVMAMGDHPECSYIGVMYQVTDVLCATLYDWPNVNPELNQDGQYIVWGP